MLNRSNNPNVDLIKYCKSVDQWGHNHTYHWFWGVVPIKSYNDKPHELSFTGVWLENHRHVNKINAWRHADLQYRNTNIVSRFFIRLFNYKNLYKQHILLTYYEMKTQVDYIREDAYKVKKGLFPWHPVLLKLIIDINHNISRNLSGFDSSIRKIWKKLTINLKRQFHSVRNNVTAYNIDKLSAKAYTRQQVAALKILGMQAAEGVIYSKNTVMQQFRNLAMRSHSDKGGTDEKFRELVSAKKLLLLPFEESQTVIWKSDSNDPEILSQDFTKICKELRFKAGKNYDDAWFSYRTNLPEPNFNNHTIIFNKLGAIRLEAKQAVLEYELLCRKIFIEFIQTRENFSKKQTSDFDFLHNNSREFIRSADGWRDWLKFGLDEDHAAIEAKITRMFNLWRYEHNAITYPNQTRRAVSLGSNKKLVRQKSAYELLPFPLFKPRRKSVPAFAELNNSETHRLVGGSR